MIFVCPKCKGALTVFGDGRAACESGHSYDRAREGYYNLLIKNNAKTHGDNKEMVLARRDFLNTGAYLPLAKKLCEAVGRYADGGIGTGDGSAGTVLLDSGCGEGYYTDYIQKELSGAGAALSVFGFDISRDAVRFAAKKNSFLSLAVASSYDMPVADGSVDILVNVFSPLALSETRRALRRGGKFIMAIPAENHLLGLKRVLYEKPYKNTVQDSHLPGFTLLSEERVEYKLCLSDKAKISALFNMTPYAYRTPPSARERLFCLELLETEIEFIVFTYERE